MARGASQIGTAAAALLPVIAALAPYWCTKADADTPGFHLNVDTAQADAVMAILGSATPDDARIAEASAMPATAAAIAHTAIFDPRATPQAWRAGLKAVCAGEHLKDDPFRFNFLHDHRADAAATIAGITADPKGFERGIENRLDPYIPPGMTVSAQMRVVAGGRATGWTDGSSDVFYFDAKSGMGDIAGVTTIAAHELYHVVLSHMLPRPRQSAQTALGRVERVLLNGIDEGMASHVARFDPAAPGALSQSNAEEDRANLARRRTNWKLIDAFLIATYHSAEVTPDDVHTIAFAGAYDEPGYYVFRDMAEAVEAARGRAYLLDLVRQPAPRFVLAYHEISRRTPDAMRLSDGTLTIIRELDAADSGGPSDDTRATRK